MINRQRLEEIINEEQQSVTDFLQGWEQSYIDQIKKLSLYTPEITSAWSQKQKETFVRVFYHIRGHFHEFLWFLGNHAQERDVKRMVLDNIAEEFNGAAASHEQMYIEFAKSLDVDLSDELIDGKSYLPEIQEFNKGHLRWLASQSASRGFASFSAYERLDNVDYAYLAGLAESIGASRKGMIFFNVHLKAQHFETTEDHLVKLWQNNPDDIRESFNFITYHQLQMWKTLAALIENIDG